MNIPLTVLPVEFLLDHDLRSGCTEQPPACRTSCINEMVLSLRGSNGAFVQVQRLREHIQKKHPEEDMDGGSSEQQSQYFAPQPGPSSGPKQVLCLMIDLLFITGDSDSNSHAERPS